MADYFLFVFQVKNTTLPPVHLLRFCLIRFLSYQAMHSPLSYPPGPNNHMLLRRKGSQHTHHHNKLILITAVSIAAWVLCTKSDILDLQKQVDAGEVTRSWVELAIL